MARSILYCRSVAGGNEDKAVVVASSIAVIREVGLVEYPVANTCGRLSTVVDEAKSFVEEENAFELEVVAAVVNATSAKKEEEILLLLIDVDRISD
jgi:uncharacterized membrane protein YdcZ (DUF606 family)